MKDMNFAQLFLRDMMSPAPKYVCEGIGQFSGHISRLEIGSYII